jgi:hypothetical protein
MRHPGIWARYNIIAVHEVCDCCLTAVVHVWSTRFEFVWIYHMLNIDKTSCSRYCQLVDRRVYSKRFTRLGKICCALPREVERPYL